MMMEDWQGNAESRQNGSGLSRGDQKCVKCSGEAIHESTSSRTPYCGPCFVKMVKGKFRTALSKRKIFRDRESRKALVVLDGTRESAYLFRQIEDSVKQTNFKRLMIEPSFLIVLSSLNDNEVDLVEQKLSALRDALDLPYYVIHLAAVFGDINIDDSGRCIGLQQLPKLVEFCSSFKTASSLEEMRRILKTRLICKFSKCIGISKVMVSSNSDELANLTIAQLCLGRGGRVSDMTNVVENTPTGVTFIRPLRDISSEEIAVALRLEDSERYILLPHLMAPLSSFSYAFEASSKGSVQQCTSQFVGHLFDEGFKGTAPNILGAASKIHLRDGPSTCSLCEYSFSGEGTLCYACSNVMKDLSSPGLLKL